MFMKHTNKRVACLYPYTFNDVEPSVYYTHRFIKPFTELPPCYWVLIHVTSRITDSHILD